MRAFYGRRMLAALLAPALLLSAAASWAEERPSFRIAWTVYAGNMPLGYAQDSGILAEWGDRYGMDLKAVQLTDYVEAQNQYTGGAFDAVVAITLDALTIPAAAGVDSSAVVMMNGSLGSDGMVMKGKGKTVKDLEGERINLVAFSGSHYMLSRALDMHGMSERDVEVVNTSDADIATAFQTREVEAVATWKPHLDNILAQNPNTSLIFDSSKIPDEITDVILVRTETLDQHPELGYALAGAWFEVVDMLEPGHPKRQEVMAHIADAAGTDLEGFEKQLSTVVLYERDEAIKLVESDAFRESLDEMSNFAFEKGLMGDSAPGPDFIGMEFENGEVLGNRNNVKLRFPSRYMQSAKDVPAGKPGKEE